MTTSTQTSAPIAATQDQDRVLRAILNMTAAFHRQDMEAVMASYAPGAVVVFEPGKPVSDPALMRQKFMGFFSVNPTFEYSGHEVFIAGDTAIHIAPWVMRGTAPDGTAVSDNGLSIAVLKRQKDGQWLMIIDDPYGSYLQKNKS